MVFFLHLFSLHTSKNSGRPEKQNHNEKRERDCVAICRKSRSTDKCFHHPKNNSANGGPWNVSDAAEHSRDKRFDSRQEPHERSYRWITERKQNSIRAILTATDTECEGNHG